MLLHIKDLSRPAAVLLFRVVLKKTSSLHSCWSGRGFRVRLELLLLDDPVRRNRFRDELGRLTPVGLRPQLPFVHILMFVSMPMFIMDNCKFCSEIQRSLGTKSITEANVLCDGGEEKNRRGQPAAKLHNYHHPNCYAGYLRPQHNHNEKTGKKPQHPVFLQLHSRR